MRELLDMARAKPGSINYGLGGIGTASHLATEMLKLMANVDMVHVPYKGLGPALTDLMGGRLHVIISTMASALPQMKSESCVRSRHDAQRSSFFPEVPTMNEAGVKGYEFSTWYGLLVPAGTAKPIVDRLNTETQKRCLRTRQEQFVVRDSKSRVNGSGFAAYLKSEVAKWGKVVKASGATPE
jgi:tripartite-type tricarboxylate transporter receptor subunit TctC